jgi:hypothetical protein
MTLEEIKQKYKKFEQDEMNTIHINWSVFDKVWEMIKEDQYILAINKKWSFTTEDENMLLGQDGDNWDAFSEVHLAEDIKFERDDKKRYLYPIIKDGVVFEDALKIGKQKAIKKEDYVAHSMDNVLGEIAKKAKGMYNDNEIPKPGNKADMKHETRVDFFFGPEGKEDEFMSKKFDKTPEGYLTGRSIITNVGVFPYVVQDEVTGKLFIRRELRPAEEVFDSDSMRSLSMKPLTNNHPDEKVDAENIKQFQAGFIGEDIRQDRFHLSGAITITDPNAINDVENNEKRALSAGYSVDLEFTPGNWNGVDYDAIQRNIRYNHVAIVDRGRAGDQAVMKLDHIDAYSINEDKTNLIQNNLGKEKEQMKKITIDGVQHDADEKVCDALNDSVKKLDETKTALDEAKKENETLKADNEKMKADLDSANETLEQTKKDLEEAKEQTVDEKKIDQAVEAKIQLKEVAKKADVEIKEEMTNMDIKKEIILVAFPNAKLDEASEVYIEARYDSAVELINENAEKFAKDKKKVSDIVDDENPANEDVTIDNCDSEEAYKRNVKSMTEAYKQ